MISILMFLIKLLGSLSTTLLSRPRLGIQLIFLNCPSHPLPGRPKYQHSLVKVSLSMNRTRMTRQSTKLNLRRLILRMCNKRSK